MMRVLSPVILILMLSCGTPEYISPDTLSSMLAEEKTVIIDLRNDKKFADGHIRGAINAEFHEATFLRDIKDSRVVLYCGEGIKSDKAADVLRKEGFRKILILQGGYNRWLGEGHKAEK
jgi:rhodanese-related sulfurtransferase